MMNRILVTGGAGFIGSNFVLEWLHKNCQGVVNLDKLTYAGNMLNLRSIEANEQHTFVRGDICDRHLVGAILDERRPIAIVHFATESHVDRSILGPEEFIRTNVQGTFCLLEEARRYHRELSASKKESFRFLHVSTDEVYGSLEFDDPPFSEQTKYAPNSPYSASKAAADHLVRSYHRTYGLPTLITNCSNNYGPYQFPEKLVPLVIFNAINGKKLPIYVLWMQKSIRQSGLLARARRIVQQNLQWMARWQRLERGNKVANSFNRGMDSGAPAELLHHVNAGASVRRTEHQAHGSIGLENVAQGHNHRILVCHMLQDSGAYDLVESRSQFMHALNG